MVTKPSTKKRYKEMAEAVRGGLSVTQVSKKFKVSERTIRFAMAHHNVRTTTRGRPLFILAEIYRAVPLKGRTMTRSLSEISRRTNVSRERVRQVFAEARKLGLLKHDLTPGK